MKLEVGTAYPVIVTKILARGIVVQHEDSPETEFIHISNLSSKFVADITDVVHVSEHLTALCILGKVTGKPELSLKHIDHKPLYNARGGQHKAAHVSSFEDMLSASTKCLEEKLRITESRAQRKHK